MEHITDDRDLEPFYSRLVFADCQCVQQRLSGMFMRAIAGVDDGRIVLQIGDTLRIDDKTTVEPWAGAALDYTFLNRTDTEGFASVDDPYADLRIQAGLNFNFGSNVQLALIGEAGGLLRDQTDSYSAEANLAFQF